MWQAVVVDVVSTRQVVVIGVVILLQESVAELLCVCLTHRQLNFQSPLRL